MNAFHIYIESVYLRTVGELELGFGETSNSKIRMKSTNNNELARTDPYAISTKGSRERVHRDGRHYVELSGRAAVQQWLRVVRAVLFWNRHL